MFNLAIIEIYKATPEATHINLTHEAIK